MSAFDWSGNFPKWEDADETRYENRHQPEGFDAMVDRFMYCDGLDRQEAEAKAYGILEDDGA